MVDVLNFEAGVIPRVGAGGSVQAGEGSGGSAAAALISTVTSKGAAGAAAAWPDDRPIAEQLWTYPATCLLVAAFVTVSVGVRSMLYVCVFVLCMCFDACATVVFE